MRAGALRPHRRDASLGAQRSLDSTLIPRLPTGDRYARSAAIGSPSDAGFWNDSLGEPPPPRPGLDGALGADVCIVGAGYTGLWTAWALLSADPSLRVVILEAVHVGFGASGRNGGWLSGLLPGDRELMAATHGAGRSGVIAWQRSLIVAVDDVIRICGDEGIDADIRRGGTLAVATTAAQLQRLRSSMQKDLEWGLEPADICELSASETAARLAVDGAIGSTFSPHCARIHPAKLVRGLADAVTARGGQIFEGSPAVYATARQVETPGGSVRARWVVRATEGYTAGLPGLSRRLLPMNSSMVVTEPLPPSVWEAIGWKGYETVRDGSHAYAYLQRTADDRIAIGGRGVPYRFGSRLSDVGVNPPQTVAALQDALHRLLPALGSSPPRVAAAWSGVLGVARDWCPSVVLDRSGAGGMAWAGGYVGDGVTTAHLAGMTLADLILGRDTPRIALPWVGHRSPDWEPEPFRWLGVQGIYALYRAADRSERRHPGRATTSPLARVADMISGRP